MPTYLVIYTRISKTPIINLRGERKNLHTLPNYIYRHMLWHRKHSTYYISHTNAKRTLTYTFSELHNTHKMTQKQFSVTSVPHVLNTFDTRRTRLCHKNLRQNTYNMTFKMV